MKVVIWYYFLFQAGLSLVKCKSNNTPFIQTVIHKGYYLHDIVNTVNAKKLETNISLKCASQIYALGNHSEVLLRMADAWSKFPYTGLDTASRNDYGNYDECISVDLHDTSSGKILGKHCAYGLIIPDILAKNETEMAQNAWKFSYCVPDGCTAEDLNNATNSFLFNEVYCSTKETDTNMDTGALITLSIFTVIIMLVIVSTIHDVYLHYNQRKNTRTISRAFSLFRNGEKLLSVSQHSGEQILCFNGIKFIGMWWIMAGHAATGWYNLPIMNEEWRTNMQHSLSSFYLMTGHLAVDSFFFISGFLLAYLYFKNEISNKSVLTQAKAVPMLIIHRYLRLTPAVLMTYLFVVYLGKYTGDGPVFSTVAEEMAKPCKKYWWAVFLYFQNYYVFHKGDPLCILSLWYLSADMQIFLITPLIVIPVALIYRNSFKKALAALTGINLLFVAVPIFTKLTWRNYDPEFAEYDCHSRFIDYFIGVAMGVYMRHEKHKSYKFNTLTNILLWTITLVVMLGTLLITQEITLNHGYVARTICLSLTRPLWCLGLCWITFACYTGRGGFVNWLLSNSFMQIGGKLTYCLYLVHGSIIANYIAKMRYRSQGSDWILFYTWCGHFIVSMAVATLWTLAFESPIITLEKSIFGHGKAKAPKAKKEEDAH